MEKRIKLFNRAIQALLGSALLFGLLFIVSCDNGDDPEPELYSLPGVYIFNEATLQTALTVPGTEITLPVGYDITDQMASGLLAAAPCDNASNGAVELKENKELYFTCRTETNDLKAGTWSINADTTELNLNLTVPQALLLSISDLEINESTDIIGGRIANFPITKDLLAGFLAGVPGGDAILAGIDDSYVQPVDVDIYFEKVSE